MNVCVIFYCRNIVIACWSTKFCQSDVQPCLSLLALEVLKVDNCIDISVLV